MEERREVWYLVDSDQLIQGVHAERWCSGVCVVHRPSNHSMREMPLGFDMKAKAFYRTCPHGDTHQDPDERTYWTRQLESRNSKTASLAIMKLSDWACPSCECGCCDITSVD